MRWKNSPNSNNEGSAPPDPLYEEVDVLTKQHNITLNLNENISYATKHNKWSQCSKLSYFVNDYFVQMQHFAEL